MGNRPQACCLADSAMDDTSAEARCDDASVGTRVASISHEGIDYLSEMQKHGAISSSQPEEEPCGCAQENVAEEPKQEPVDTSPAKQNVDTVVVCSVPPSDMGLLEAAVPSDIPSDEKTHAPPESDSKSDAEASRKIAEEMRKAEAAKAEAARKKAEEKKRAERELKRKQREAAEEARKAEEEECLKAVAAAKKKAAEDFEAKTREDEKRREQEASVKDTTKRKDPRSSTAGASNRSPMGWKRKSRGGKK
eukprot:TRINITY_DN56369_c0_g1_i1.p2 TRINITY_DN56369_c0_g1~~TRINITY_DN56369_c0_g1_i1.p2  ORF type:complete len:283 (+),score=61.95 TRINITY_DN56369_c0_g1_i1:101-850(+)